MENGSCINKVSGEFDNKWSCYANEEFIPIVEYLFIGNPHSVSLFNKDHKRVGQIRRGAQEDMVHSLLVHESIHVNFRCE